MWAGRLVHESRLHDDSIFITLTYNPASLPTGGTLVKRHLQLFFKRLRKSIAPKKVRYYAVGEYGDENLRPHYHIILFGYRFEDAKLLRETKGHRFHSSAALETLWPYGLSEFGEVTAETCAYCARYVIKKINGARAASHYERVTTDGEIVSVIPEFAAMSRRPGIARDWFSRYASDVYPDDFIILNGRRSKVPRFYDALLEKSSPDDFAAIKDARLKRSRRRRADQTPERLAVREKCLKAKISVAQRKL